MSVIVKGMEMPKNCCECIHTVWNGWDDVCRFSGISALNIGRQVDCPLIKVPPHGDLIDRDALMKSDRMVGKLMMFGGEYVYTQSEIDCAPTIIPADVTDTNDGNIPADKEDET